MFDIFRSIIQNPKGINFESQERDEKVFFLLRKHPITNLGWMSFSVVLLVLPVIVILVSEAFLQESYVIFPPKYQLAGAILWYMFAMLYAFESFLIWYFSVYIITGKRLIDIDFIGLWHKRVSEASYDNIEDVTYRTSSIWNILFNYGDIYIQTAGKKREFDFHDIPKPALVHDKFTDLVHDYNQNKNNKK